MPTTDAPLASGRTAEVFAWDDGRVLKLFRVDWGMRAATHEAEIARAIYASGAPSPRVDDVATVDGRAGVIYERITGPALLAVLFARPWRLAAVARILAETHAGVHARTVPCLPLLHEQLTERIRSVASLPAAHQRAALRALDSLAATMPPAMPAMLCHGDFHPGNVLLSARGPLVIDWENAALGDPLADVARTQLLMRAFYVQQPSGARHAAMHAAAATLSALYLRRYRQLRPTDAARLAAWQLPIAAARLSEGIAAEDPYLLARVQRLCARAQAA